MNDRAINKQKYMSVFAITTLIFISGILLGNHFSENKISELTAMSERIQLNTLGAELQFLIASKEPCKSFNETILGEELYSIGSKLDFMENELGKKNKEVLSLKEYYHLLELRHWLLLRQVNEQCSQKLDRILFFYSNEGDCGMCQEQGGVLTYIHKKNPQLSVYSFDKNIDNPGLRTLRELYGVGNELPVLVINEIANYGFMNSKQIEEALSKSNSTS